MYNLSIIIFTFLVSIYLIFVDDMIRIESTFAIVNLARVFTFLNMI